MTDKALHNSFNKPDTEYLTEVTLKVRVPLSVDDIRRLVVAQDEEDCGPEDAISPEHVSGVDFITLWLLSEYRGDTLITVDEMVPIPRKKD